MNSFFKGLLVAVVAGLGMIFIAFNAGAQVGPNGKTQAQKDAIVAARVAEHKVNGNGAGPQRYDGPKLDCSKLTPMQVAWLIEVGGVYLPDGTSVACTSLQINTIEAGNAPSYAVQDALNNGSLQVTDEMRTVAAGYKAFREAKQAATESAELDQARAAGKTGRVKRLEKKLGIQPDAPASPSVAPASPAATHEPGAHHSAPAPK